jgi:hypothetical protein
MRTAVYCATRNLYGDMETAAKSLLKNTPSVERVWFLIEDDEFPRPLPDCIRVKNVSGQTWFKPGGWNISNWTDGNFLERKIRHYAAEGKSRYRQPLWLMYERMPWEKVRPQVSRK